MDFGLSEEQRAIQEASRAFSDAELAPNAARWDEEKHFPIDVLRQAAALGLAAIYVREDVGGSGLGRVEAALVFEALARGCVSTAAFLSIHNMCGWMLDRYGSDALRQDWLPRLAAMETVASYCLTEPGSGSDAASLRTAARRDGGDYVLNGSKAFISGGGVSDIYLVMCRTSAAGSKGISTILVEKGTAGLSFGAQEKKLGWNSQPTAMVQFDDCRVPASNLIGQEGEGFRIAMSALDGGRVNIGACSLGGAGFALESALAYVQTRQQFGRPLAGFQALQFKLADMATDLEASRLMVLRAATAIDAGDPNKTRLCAMAKRFSTDACFAIADQALQLHGGYGYLKDYPLERILRDLRVHRILEGTNEIMRVIIAREMLRP